MPPATTGLMKPQKQAPDALACPWHFRNIGGPRIGELPAQRVAEAFGKPLQVNHRSPCSSWTTEKNGMSRWLQISN